MRSQRGVTLIEALITISIVAISIGASMYLLQGALKARQNAALSINLVNWRANIISSIQSDLAWSNTVQDASNNSMTCILNVQDCAGQAASQFALHDASGYVLYDPRIAQAGIGRDASKCFTYSTTNGDASCPVTLNLTWKPLCPTGAGATCFNPQVEVDGKFSVSAGASSPLSINISRLNFRVVRQKSYCATQVNPVPLVAQSAQVKTDGSTTAVATEGGKIYPVGDVITNANIQLCQSGSIYFYDTVGFSNGAGISDPQNQADVCIYDSKDNPSSPVCIYEWTQSQGNWVLKARGNTVFTPAVGSFSTSTQFEFQINDGQVTFYVGNARTYLFNEVYPAPVRVEFQPSSIDYSPQGMSGISITFQ